MTVTGGTGRFSDAAGEFDVSGIAYSDGSYVQDLDGSDLERGSLE